MPKPRLALADDPTPDRVKVVLFATPPLDYVTETAAEWVAKGFAGFLRPDIMKGWNFDIWGTAGGGRTVGEGNPVLEQCRAMNAALSAAGAAENFIVVPFAEELPDWFDDPAWDGVCENFREGARFARMAGFRGMALDDEYIEDTLGLNWHRYRVPGYPFAQLREKARQRGREIQRAMLSEFPEMVTFHLPESYSIMGQLAKELFLGYMEALAEADAPGGMDILPESTYFQTDPWWIAVYGYGLDRVLLDDLARLDATGALSDYWKRRCGIALGQAPLGYLRFIRDADGKRIGYGGREEVFGEKLIESGEDKSGNYSAEVFRETHAAVRTVSRRYAWVFCPGPVWWQMTEEQQRRYGANRIAALPLAPDFNDYTQPLRSPELAADVRFSQMRKALIDGTPVDVLAGQGMPRAWWVNGPYDNAGGKGYDTRHEPEVQIDLTAELEGAWGAVRWNRVATPPMGYVDLSRLIAGGSEIQGYAVTWCELSEPIDAVLRFGCDDTGKLWLNGDLLFQSNTERIAVPDEDTVLLHLPAGRSTFLLKIGNYLGGWGFYFRITDAAGSEIRAIRWME